MARDRAAEAEPRDAATDSLSGKAEEFANGFKNCLLTVLNAAATAIGLPVAAAKSGLLAVAEGGFTAAAAAAKMGLLVATGKGGTLLECGAEAVIVGVRRVFAFPSLPPRVEAVLAFRATLNVDGFALETLFAPEPRSRVGIISTLTGAPAETEAFDPGTTSFDNGNGYFSEIAAKSGSLSGSGICRRASLASGMYRQRCGRPRRMHFRVMKV